MCYNNHTLNTCTPPLSPLPPRLTRLDRRHKDTLTPSHIHPRLQHPSFMESRIRGGCVTRKDIRRKRKKKMAPFAENPELSKGFVFCQVRIRAEYSFTCFACCHEICLFSLCCFFCFCFFGGGGAVSSNFPNSLPA